MTVLEVTNNSISLAWNYTGIQPEGFHIDVTVTNHAYPKLEPQTTKDTKITIKNLSPGVKHQFKVSTKYTQQKFINLPIDGSSNLYVLLFTHDQTVLDVYRNQKNWVK